MQIDWITVSAQIVNFLVLVWLLKRFLYQPVMRAMERREQRIADRLNEAEAREHEADDKARQYEEKATALDRDRQDILSEAREKADEQRRHLLDEARAGVDEQRRQWQQQLEQEQHEFAEGLQRRTRDAVQHIARRALRDLADTGLEERIVDAFIARLKSADDELLKALGRGEGPVRIRTTFDLEPAVRSRLTRAVHEHVVADVEVDYGRSEALLSGIELRRGDRRLGWNLAEYMDELADRVDEAFRPAATGQQEG
jgi:F-type H+-transporting ATPase subunit b